MTLKIKYAIFMLGMLFFVLGSVRFLPAKAQTTDWTTYEDYDPLVMAGYSAGDWQSVADGNALGFLNSNPSLTDDQSKAEFQRWLWVKLKLTDWIRNAVKFTTSQN